MRTPESKSVEKKVRVYQGFLPLYNWPYKILIGPDTQRLGAIMEKALPGLHIVDDIDVHTGAYALHARHHEEGDDFSILLNPHLEYTKEEMVPIIAHEALHLSWFFANHFGIELDYENHEAQAYILQHIVQECKLALEDYIKRQKLDITL